MPGFVTHFFISATCSHPRRGTWTTWLEVEDDGSDDSEEEDDEEDEED